MCTGLAATSVKMMRAGSTPLAAASCTSNEVQKVQFLDLGGSLSFGAELVEASVLLSCLAVLLPIAYL